MTIEPIAELKLLRITFGVSMSATGRLSGLGKSMINSLENGRAKATPERLSRYRAGLRVALANRGKHL